MRVISRKKLQAFAAKHPRSQTSLDRWYRLLRAGDYGNFNEVKSAFPAADQVGNFVVFNVGGNHFRVVVLIDYRSKTAFIRHVMDHAEYSKNAWKKDSWFSAK